MPTRQAVGPIYDLENRSGHARQDTTFGRVWLTLIGFCAPAEWRRVNSPRLFTLRSMYLLLDFD